MMVIMWAIVGTAAYVGAFGRIGRFDPPRLMCIFIGLFLLLFAWLVTQSFKSSLRPTNWLMRIRGNDLLIKFRSYENWRLSDDDVQVIELNHDEIESARI